MRSTSRLREVSDAGHTYSGVNHKCRLPFLFSLTLHSIISNSLILQSLSECFINMAIIKADQKVTVLFLESISHNFLVSEFNSLNAGNRFILNFKYYMKTK